MKLFNSLKGVTVKHSPEIMTVLGAVCLVVGGYKAATGIKKIKDAKDEFKDDRLYLEEAAEDENTTVSKRETVKLYGRFVLDCGKAVAPAAVLFAAGTTCLVWSNKEWRKRCAALTAWGEGLDLSFKKYRKWVVDNYGEEVDKKAIRGESTIEIVEDNGDGKKPKKRKEVVTDEEAIDANPYVFVFSKDTSYEWKKSNTYNRMFIEGQLQAANDLLKVKESGMLFLNEVLELLGMKPTASGNIVGWRYEPDNNNIDNLVDFGISLETLDFYESSDAESIILEFNCDGNILQFLPETQLEAKGVA